MIRIIKSTISLVCAIGILLNSHLVWANPNAQETEQLLTDIDVLSVYLSLAKRVEKMALDELSPEELDKVLTEQLLYTAQEYVKLLPTLSNEKENNVCFFSF